MARIATFPKHAAPEIRRPRTRVGFGDGPPPTGVSPPISNAQLGMLIFMAFEAMIFVGLITAYWVLRTGSFTWPPPNLPRLPLGVTWVNTAVLLLSGFTMSRAASAVRAGDQEGLRTMLVGTAMLGAAFLAAQGTEWVQLIRQGLTLSSGSYGSTFYTLIGLHALHVFGAVVWLGAIAILAQRGRYSASRHTGITLCTMYWYFVCALWVVLFAIVYLY